MHLLNLTCAFAQPLHPNLASILIFNFLQRNLAFMDNSTWRQKLSYFTLFLPVRMYLLLFAVGTGLAYWWVNTQKPGVESAFGVVLALLVKVAAWFIVSVLLLSLLSVLVPFVLF